MYCEPTKVLVQAAILQHTADYIYQLEQEKTRLLSQNCQLKRLLQSQMGGDSDGSDSPLPKRLKHESTESSDEGIGNMSPKEPPEELRREMVELRLQLERERKLRLVLEEHSAAAAAADNQVSSEESPSEDNSPPVKSEPLSPVTELPQDLSAPPKEDPTPLYHHHASTSRQNLETIVEAIRHLEGDHLFSDTTKEEGSCPKLNQALLLGSSDFRHKVITQLRPGVIVTNHS
ncbi:TFAP4 [Cordylochernes scorpioides]|uniref:TFAP4 n=1 Tax=Cordylochernes scorpioides TaxID=51811 RepID=A0ABY6JWU8_9ARAC|nr:TFAP4 [Cordylochernes scorpioides]